MDEHYKRILYIDIIRCWDALETRAYCQLLIKEDLENIKRGYSLITFRKEHSFSRYYSERVKSLELNVFEIGQKQPAVSF